MGANFNWMRAGLIHSETFTRLILCARHNISDLISHWNGVGGNKTLLFLFRKTATDVACVIAVSPILARLFEPNVSKIRSKIFQIKWKKFENFWNASTRRIFGERTRGKTNFNDRSIFNGASRERGRREGREGSNLFRQVVSYPLRKAIAGEWEKRIWNRPWQTRYYRSAYRVNNIVGSHNLFFCGRDRGQWDETLVSWSSLVPCRKETRRGWWEKRRRKRRKERKNEE